MSSTSDSAQQVQATPRGEEPAMYLQRPSTGRSQDVRHILARSFRDLYTRESVRPETVKNLQVSKGGDDPYHERYVESLQKVYDEWARRMEEAAMLERHIMQAQARAMSADERDLQRAKQSYDQYDTLGLPPVRAHFKSCIDTQLLRDHSLLTPEDYSTEQAALVPPPSVPKPKAPAVPRYALETRSSLQHSRQKDLESQPLHPIGTKIESGESLELPSFLSDLESLPGVEHQQAERLPPGEEKFPSVNAWKTYMGTEDRLEGRDDLQKMEAKVNFMRNPRYLVPADSGNKALIKTSKPKPKEPNKPVPPIEPEEDAPVFITSPPEVVFRDYKVGQVYEITLELKNVSTVMRNCRALPPKSNYFSVGLGQFPGDQGLVAPGMGCHFPIRFAPDSLKDFDDEIVFQTQASQILVIKLKGRREPPCLTIPPNLDIGCSLVRGFQVTQFAIANHGGPGRFCIMPRALWPATNFKSVIQNGSVNIPPFEIRPSTLELDRGQVTVIEVMFKPTVTRVYYQEFTILCDNCHVQHFTVRGEGQVVKVLLTDIERGESVAQPGELRDRTAQHLLKFDDLNPFTYTERSITVKNFTSVLLPFQWMVYKPQMQRELPTPMNEMEDEAPVFSAVNRDPEEDRVPEVDSVFSIQPPSGILEPQQSVEFRITFAPPVISEFHNVAHLLIQQVPPASQSRMSNTLEGEPVDENNSQDELSNMGHSDVAAVPYHDMTALEIEMKGKSIALNVVLHPYALFMPGSYLVGHTVKRLFTMANHSFSTITFQWEPVHDDKKILEVEPPFGELDPGMAMDLELSVTGTVPGHISHTLFCYVLNLEEPLHFHVDTTIKGPMVVVDEPSLNFGLVRFGDTAEKEMTLRSLAQVITKWSLQDRPLLLEHEPDDDRSESEFKFLPASGELRPLEEKIIVVQFTPKEVKSVQRTFTLDVEDGNTLSIGVYAEVQQPKVCLLECELRLPEVYVGVPVIFQAGIFNQTLLPTVFEWGQVEGSQASECQLEVEERVGGLHSREKHQVKMTFCPSRGGEYNEVRIPCTIRGQKDVLFLNLSCFAKSLAVKYRTSDDGEVIKNEALIRCGELQIGEQVVRYLHIRNETAIAADFNVSMQTFSAVAPTPPPLSVKASGTGRPSLTRTSNLGNLSKSQSKFSTDVKTTVLSKDLGAAFLLQPASGILQPFGEQVIAVTAYCDMWGEYSDNIISCVGDLTPVKIPITMTVHGCPLNFKMTAANPDQHTILRFGTLVAGTDPVTRQVRINNASPFDIRLDWRVYNHEEDSKNRLVDFFVCYGRSFPPLDADGNEIVPRTPEPPRTWRAPTDDIPNSPDTSSSEIVVSGDQIDRTMTASSSESSAEQVSMVDSTVTAAITSELSANKSSTFNVTKNPKIISIFLRPHDGKESFVPYNILPKQLTIPAKGFATVLMTFTPPPVEDCTQEVDCFSYALGYLSIDDESARIKNKVKRCEAFEAQQLRIDYTAHVKPALLTIEETDDEGMTYQSAMSDILNSDKLLPESLSKRSLMLSNGTLTPLTFRLKVKSPFALVDLGTPGSDNKSRVLETDYHTLRPAHNIMVKVALRVTPTMLAEYQKEHGTEIMEQVEADSKLCIKDHLIIEFNNGTQQKVELKAVVAVPQMTLSKTELDFGTCLVGQRRELQLMISNSTASHSQWTACFESKSITCIPDTFQISPTHGMLDAHITHISNSKMLLCVFFTAKHAEPYEAVILFQGMLGEAHQRLYVRGQGSYDGRHEAILNV